MIGWEKRVLLRHYLAQGLTKAVIAERLGINRRTINRWISKGDLDRDVDATVPRYGPRPAVPTKLDPFKPIIETRLKALPELSAVRLPEEIRAAGYTGGYTQLKEYVRKIRPRETEAVVRFETPPGHQAQVDFADFRLPWGKRYALLVVLGYSRLLWLHFFARKDMVACWRALSRRSRSSAVSPGSCSSIRCTRSSRRMSGSTGAGWFTMPSSSASARTGASRPAPADPTGPRPKGGGAAGELRARQLLLRPGVPERP